MSCPSTKGGQPCLIPDPRHLELHDGGPGVKWTDLAADEAQEKAA